VDKLERALDWGEFGAIVIHLFGLDDGKDRGLPTDGAISYSGGSRDRRLRRTGTSP